MKITFVLPYASIAGGIRVAAIYAEKLAALGHEITVVSRGGTKPTRGQKLKRLMAGAGKRHSRKPPTRQLDFLGDRHIVLDHPFPIRPDEVPDADVIIATWWETAFAVAALPASKGRKFYFIQHHEVHGHLPNHISAGSYYLPLKKITISQWLVDTMAEHYGDTDVALVENSVDLTMFHAPERGRQTQPTVGLLYAKTRFKGVDISLKAIARARARVPDLQLIAFGAKDIDPALPLPPGTIYHKAPDQDKIREIYAACDAWLFSSRTEGFGLPILEAMACRTPVVATRTGAAPDVIDDSNGHIVDVEDHVALGDRLADVLSLPPADWKAMSDAAYARAQSYSWDDAARKFTAFIGEDGDGSAQGAGRSG